MTVSDDHEKTLFAAWSLAGCDHAEASTLAEHASSCPSCLDEATTRRLVADLLVELDAEAESEPGGDENAPVPSLGSACLGSRMPELESAPLDALFAAARSRRRPAPAVPPFAGPFAAAAGMLDAVLAEVDPERLGQPGPVLDWTAGDLVAHLAAGNAQLAAVIGATTKLPIPSGTDLVVDTRALLAATAGLSPDSLRRMWRSGVDAIAARLLAEPDLATRVAKVTGAWMTVADHVVIRGFETWIHARDIGRVAGVELPRPSSANLRSMADLAARVLDGRPAPVTPGRSGAVRLTLTGPVGGSWLVGIGAPASVAEPDAELTLDAFDFCLLVADRVAPAELETAFLGDEALVEEFFALAPTISGP